MRREYHIIGVSTIGFPLAIRIYKSKEVTLHLWDDDIIKENDVVFPKQYAGQPKVEIAKRIISARDDSIIVHNQRATNDSLKRFKNKFVIDCTDTKSEFKLKANIKISYDGPILSISDGRFRNFTVDTPFHYPKNRRQINQAVDIIMDNLQSSFSYVNYKRKVYKLPQTNGDKPEIIYSSKRLSTTQQVFLNDKNPLQIPKTLINKKVKQLERRKVSDIFYEIGYMDPLENQLKILTLPQCDNIKMANAIRQDITLVKADEYYLNAKGIYTKDNIGFLQLELLHLPTGC